MRYKDIILRAEGKEYIQLSKTKAKRMFYAEKTILLLSSNLAFDNVWEKPYSCNIKKYMEEEVSPAEYEKMFDILCNSFRHYNCDRERGKYIHFFMEK